MIHQQHTLVLQVKLCNHDELFVEFYMIYPYNVFLTTQLAISIIFLSKFQFSWKEMFAEKFFSLCSKFARPVDSSGGRASTNPQIWQLFLQATSQVMTAHNLFAPSHSVVLPFGFILKLIPDANFAVHYYTTTRWSSRFANALLVKAHWVPLGFYT